MEMENKVVLTIGSTAGIGKAIAETFAANGATAITGQILYVDGGASLG